MAKTKKTLSADTDTLAEKTDGNESVVSARAAAVYVHVASLKRHPKNPRNHGPETVALARTILRTAWGAPIVARKSNRRIIGGHGRLDAAELILEGVEVDGELLGGPGYCFEPGAPPECLPTRYVDVSAPVADAMTLADNAKALQGVDDPTLVIEMAAQFGRDASVMVDIGLSADALDALIKSAGDDVLANSSNSAPRDGVATGDLQGEWQGLPEYESKDHNDHRTIIVHFQDDDAVQEFKQRLGVVCNENTKFVWFPPMDTKDPDKPVGLTHSKAYVVPEA